MRGERDIYSGTWSQEMQTDISQKRLTTWRDKVSSLSRRPAVHLEMGSDDCSRSQKPPVGMAAYLATVPMMYVKILVLAVTMRA